MHYRLFVCLALILLLASTASAGIKPGAFTLSPLVGGHIFDNDQNLDDGIFGALGLGYNLTDKAALEAVFSQTDAEGEESGDSDAEVDIYRLDALYHFLPDKDLVPYLAIGFGGIKVDPDNGAGNHHFAANAGGGIKYFINDSIGLRADVRYLFDFAESDENLLYSAGLVFQFGAPPPAPEPMVEEQPVATPVPPPAPTLAPLPQPAPEPAPEPVPVAVPQPPGDSDKDGVNDDLDRCPDTPIGVSVDADGCPTKLTLKINFGHDSDRIGPEYDGEISKAAQCINDYPGNVVYIDGHTDSQGSAAYNQQLSEQRANAVKNRLIEKFGIPAERMTARGFGESQPVADNATAEGRSENRRVDVACGATQ